MEKSYRKYSAFLENILLREKLAFIRNLLYIENRIYREELKESLGMNFFSHFQHER